MQTVEILGLAAGTCTTAAFLPQVIQVWQTRSTSDISLSMYCTLLLGILLWLACGIIMSSISIVLANGVTLFLAGSVLVMKLRFEKARLSSENQ
jgi:MtN3 and saliva related transmembrane protein